MIAEAEPVQLATATSNVTIGPIQYASDDDDRYVIVDDRGEVAGIGRGDDVEAGDGPSSHVLMSWMDHGVPGFRSQVNREIVKEKPIIVHPDNPLFGLAFADHLERIGWRVIADGEPLSPVQNAATMRKEDWIDWREPWWADAVVDVANAFCPTGEGGGVDPSCSPHRAEGGLSEKELPAKPTFEFSSIKQSMAETIHELAKKGDLAGVKTALGSMLVEHSPKLKSYAETIAEKLEQKGVKLSPALTASELPAKPEFISKQQANVDANNKAVEEMAKLAAAGKLDELKAHPGTPSPKLQEYKAALIDKMEIKGGLKPKPPPDPMAHQIQDIGTAEPAPTPVPVAKSLAKPEPAAELKPTGGQALSDHIKNKGGFTGLSDGWYKKVAALNPEGFNGSAVIIPKPSSSFNKEARAAAFAKQAAIAAFLAPDVPNGTPIKTPKSYISAEKAGIKKKYGVGEEAEEYTTGGQAGEVLGHGADVGQHFSMNNSKRTPTDQLSGENWAKFLTAAEKDAIQSWKGKSSEIRKAVASGNLSSSSYGDAKAFMSAISKAKPFSSVTYRGIGGSYAAQLREDLIAAGTNKWFIDPAPHNTSMEPSTSYHSFSGDQLLLRIKMKTGRQTMDSDGYGQETESVGMPGTKYKVVGLHKDCTLTFPAGKKNKGGNHVPCKLLVDLEEV